MFSLSKGYSQSGKVFHDFNGNGILNTGEPGVSGIIVRSYSVTNALYATATSDNSGNYSLSPAAAPGQRLRIEFEIPAAKNFFKPSLNGGTYGSNVQFVTGNVSGINFAVLNPAKYTEGNPFIAVPSHVKGNQITGLNANEFTLVSINNAWGTNTPTNANYTTSVWTAWRTPSAPIGLARAHETGTTYGVAYSKTRKKVYTSAFYRQFSGFGPGGPGAIYQIPVDPVTGTRTATPSLFTDVASMPGVTVMGDIHGDDLTTLAHSDARLEPTTKNSLGDLEISDDETKLYTVNLTSREVIAINATTGAMINKWAVPTVGLTNSVGPANPNDIRPFGLGYKDGELYVGAVCTGESTVVYDGTYGGARGNRNTLHAYVWRLNESTGVFTLVFNFRLRDFTTRYFCWQSSWANGVRILSPTDDWPSISQPILSDIEFYGNDMTIALRDRQGDLWGYEIMDPVTGRFAFGTTDGDIVGAAYNPVTNTYTLESSGTLGSRVATGPYASSDISQNEFYRGDGATNFTNSHTENAMGGLAQYGAYPLIFSTITPAMLFNTYLTSNGGLGWINNENGNAVKAYIAYQSASSLGTMGKANGLGDVEVLGGEAPTEIGNRVWSDVNANSIQDADEPGIAGVLINLYDASGAVLLATTTTNANGNWFFNRSNVTDGSIILPGLQTGLQPNETYKVRIANTMFNMQGAGPLAGYFLCIPGQGAGANPGFSDADALLSLSGEAEITVTIGDAGESNHNLDFGLSEALIPLAVNNILLTAASSDNNISLTWKVNSADDAKLFTIEKSYDNRNFVSAAGISADPNRITYHYNLKENTNGSIYFRIRSTDINNKIVYSNAVHIKKTTAGLIKIYPNPANEMINIQLPTGTTSGTAVIEMINAAGQLVKRLQFQNQAVVISTKNIPDGVYYLVFINNKSLVDKMPVIIKH